MYNHYVAIDWAMSNMAIARMTSKSKKINVIDVPSDIKEVQIYLKALKGTICLTIEETTTSRWLYTELYPFVEKLIICDPYRNKLLSDGPKNDKIDASKLVFLLKNDLLKEVYHSHNEIIDLRKLVSGYDDLVKAGVRLKNQRSALFRAENKSHKKESEVLKEVDSFVLKAQDKQILLYENEREKYKKEFKRLIKKYKDARNLTTIPGIGDVAAIKILARVVDAKRFSKRNNYLSYCGLVKFEKISGGRSYGKRLPRYCREMKGVYKTAALSTLRGDSLRNEFTQYYWYLIEEKGYTEFNARHAVSRKIACVSYGILKNGKPYDFKINKV